VDGAVRLERRENADETVVEKLTDKRGGEDVRTT
jgi:hypothetical protein